MSPQSGFLSMLLPDETSRRAFEETLADWREERGRARTMGALVLAEIRGGASVLRVIASEGGRELAALEAWRLFFWTLVTAVLISWLNPVVWDRALDLAAGDTGRVLSLSAWMVAGSLALTFVVAAAAGPGQTSGRPVPTLASLALSVAFLYLASGWFAPLAERRAADARAAQFHTRDAQDAALADQRNGKGEVDQFLRQVSLEESRARAGRRNASLRFGFILAAPTAFLLGLAVRRRLPGRTPWRLAQLAGVAALIACVTAGINLWPLLRSSFSTEGYRLLQGLEAELWLGLGIAWLSIGALSGIRSKSGAIA